MQQPTNPMVAISNILLILVFLCVNYANSEYYIIDTDGYNDDARALIIALRQSKDNVKILGINAVAGSTPVSQTVANVNRIRRLVNRMDVPIYKGSNTSLLNDPERIGVDKVGADGFGDRPDLHPILQEADYNVAKKHHATLALVHYANKYPNQVTLITLGPLTNVALALRMDPSFAHKLKAMYIMGGNYLGIGNLGTWVGRPSAEFNLFLDPEAAETVLMDMRVPITIIPWETAAMYSNISQWEFLKKSDDGGFDYSIFYKNTDVSRFLHGISETVLDPSNEFYVEYIDEVAVAAALFPEQVIKKTMKFNSVNVDLRGPLSRGQMVISWLDYGKKHPNQDITFIVDYQVSELRRLMLDAVHYNTTRTAKSE